MTIFLGQYMECLNFTSLLIETKQLAGPIVYFLSTPHVCLITPWPGFLCITMPAQNLESLLDAFEVL